MACSCAPAQALLAALAAEQPDEDAIGALLDRILNHADELYSKGLALGIGASPMLQQHVRLWVAVCWPCCMLPLRPLITACLAPQHSPHSSLPPHLTCPPALPTSPPLPQVETLLGFGALCGLITLRMLADTKAIASSAAGE